MQRFFVVAHHIEAAALGGAFRPEGADNNMASGSNRGSGLPDIRGALLRRGQKMKNGAIMPDVVSLRREVNGGDIADKPRHAFCRSAQSFLRYVNRGFGNVQDGDVLVAARDEIVNERRFAPADVDNGC